MVVNPTESIIPNGYFSLPQEVLQKGGLRKSYCRMLSVSEDEALKWEMKSEIIL